MTFQFPMTANLCAARSRSMIAEGQVMQSISEKLAELEALTGEGWFLGRVSELQSSTEAEPADPDLTRCLKPLSITVPDDLRAATITEVAAIDALAAVEPASAIPAAETAMPQPAPRTEPRKRHADWAGLTTTERRIVEHVERLPSGFEQPQFADVILVETLTAGKKIEDAARVLKVSAGEALSRWRALIAHEVCGLNGKPSPEGQKRLLAALRYRVKEARDA